MAPENTLAGIRLAAELGFRAVEFDVMLSSDGVPVLIHDESLERTTNGRGLVSETSYAALRGLDAGSWLDARFAGERIPTLEEAARLCQSLGLAVNLEIKPATGYERETGRVVGSQAAGYWQGQHLMPLLSSFSAAAMEAAAEAAPDLPRGLLFGTPPADWLERVRAAGAVGLHCCWRNLSESMLADAAKAGLPVAVYTCNDPLEAERLWAAGVRSVFTDRLDLLAPG